MLLLVGLGNPGAPYQANRHNIGFMAVDRIHAHYHFPNWSQKFQALVAEKAIDGEKILLLKPQTFMNLSGQSVGAALRFYKMSLESLIVVHDELDLLPGRARLKKGGGSGGHNGIKSIDAHCGVDYRRLRLGIGHPGDRALVHSYVLGNFAKVDHIWLEPLLAALSANITLLARGEDASLMNKLALSVKDKKQEI